jgi:F0F1-type ATP synthase assembly protein I
MATNNDWWQKGLNLFVRLSAWIAAPVLLAVLVGKWLDTKFNSEPWLFLATVGLSFVVSMFGLIKEASQEFKKINAAEDKNKTDEKK